ncbi:monofunctional biosynthetic peptidoglycan transglycosylase [Amylibacter sp.]|nr:monofunctional biosynthetic peptidoglycan transglycosylase [Amylibacter sp.]MDC1252133.1 monofunctional biosynthetic peptidoglycan transglycosylase [Amylibacter sp.]
MFIALIFFIPLYFVIIFGIYNPNAGFYMGNEARRLGEIKQNWVEIEKLPPVVIRSLIAAEDANFCKHFGFDIDAIFKAIESGSSRGASTITQQVAKNVFLWHGRTYLRKGLEAGFTILIELVWTKKRILEVYLNVAEFDEGVFGIGAASKHYFNINPNSITPLQAARLMAILPDPKNRSPNKPSKFLHTKTKRIISGAETILIDGRASCF